MKFLDMNKAQIFRLLPVLVFFLAALPADARQQLHGHVKREWDKYPIVGSLPVTQQVAVAIGLPLRNQEALQYLLKSLYDPKNRNYHHFLTPEKFGEMFGPLERDYEAVKNFARNHGLRVEKETAGRGIVLASGPVQAIEAAFNVHLQNHQRPDGKKFFAPDTEPSIDLDVPVLHVSGLDNASLPRPRYRIKRKLSSAEAPAFLESLKNRKSKAVPNVGGETNSNFPFVGGDIRQAYVPCTSLTGVQQSVGLMELDSYFPNDIQTYETVFTTPSWSPNVDVVPIILDDTTPIVGYQFCGTPFDPGQVVEVTLDIQMAIAMAPGLTQAAPGGSQAYGVVVYEGIQIPYLYATSEDWILYNMAYPPAGVPLSQQLSSSWSIVTDSFLDQVVFPTFAAQGQSFFQAAGDDGSYQSGDFPDPLPDIGVSEPYMTVVGGTSLFTDPFGNWSNEVVWNDTQCFLQNWTPTPGVTPAVKDIGSGGIYTYPTPIPTYQVPFINSGNQGSSTERNLPDVSMVADNILTVADNYPTGMVDWTYWYYTGNIVNTGYVVGAGGGTSYATPLWAGFTALVNQQAQANNLGPIGFVNPALYNIAYTPASYSSDFNDITSGNNATNGTDGSCSPALSTTNGTNGYPAVPGYDLSTGLGSPRCNLINDLVPYAPTLTSTFTITPTSTFTSTPTLTPTFSCTQTPTNSPTSTATLTATKTSTLTATLTVTKTPTSTATVTATKTVTKTFTVTATLTATKTPTKTNTGTPTKTPTKGSPTATFTKTGTPTVTRTPTKTFTSTATPSATKTPTSTATLTATKTNSSTPTATFTLSFTSSATSTATNTTTSSTTSTTTDSPTATPTGTPTPTATVTSTFTFTSSFSPVNTWTPTATLAVCGTGQPGGSWTQQIVSPLPNGLAALAFNPNDGNGNRLFVLPGGGSNTVWSSFTGTSWASQTIVPAFGGLNISNVSNLTNYGSCAFEDFLWIVGGLLSGTPTNSVWNSWDGVHWTQVSPPYWMTPVPANNPPFSARWGHTLLSFGTNVNMYVIGGATGTIGPVLNDVWFTSNGQNWAQATPTIPGQVFPARAEHSSVVFNNKMWVIGGLTTPGTSGTALNDVWYTADGNNWYPSLPSSSGQIFTPRYNAQVVVCGNAIWLIGGTSPTGAALTDTWVSQDGANWTQVNTTANPFTGAMAVPYQGEVWAIQSGTGVWNTSCCELPTPTATTDPTPTPTAGICSPGQPGNTWAAVATGTPPAGMSGMTAFDSGNGQGTLLWLFGTYTVQGAPVGGDWYSTNNGSSWTQAPQNISQSNVFATYATNGHRTDYGMAVFNGKIYVIGGYTTGGQTLSDIWYSTDGINWDLATSSPAFGHRSGFGLVVYNNMLWLIGGASTLTPNDAKNDVWNSSNGVVWNPVTSNGGFTPRYRLGAVVLNGQMYIFGGDGAFTYPPACNPNGAFNDVLTSTTGTSWNTVTSSAAFPAGAGWDSTVCGNDIWVMTNTGVWVSPDGANWTQTNTAGSYNLNLGEGPKPLSYNENVYLENPSGNTWVWNSPCCTLPTPTPTVDPTPTATLAMCASGQPGNGWTLAATPTPPASMNGMVAFDAGTGQGPQMWQFGTYTVFGGPVGGVWTSSGNGNAWVQAPQNNSQSNVFTNGQLAGRNDYGIANFNGKLYVIGGFTTGGSTLSDEWYSSDGVNWNQLTTTLPFGHRTDFGLVVYNNKMWLIGGASTLTPNDAKNDVWYTVDGVNWCEATASAAFTARYRLGAVVLNNQMYVLGGDAAFTYPPACNSNAAFNDVWTSTDGANWTQVTPSAAFPAGAGWDSVACGNAMWVLANKGVWVSPDGANWTQTTLAAPFSETSAGIKPISYDNNVWISNSTSSGWVWSSGCCLVPTPTATVDPTPTATLAVCSTGPGNAWTVELTPAPQPSGVSGMDAFDAGQGPLLWAFGTYTVFGAPTGGVWNSPNGSNWTQVPQNSSQSAWLVNQGGYGVANFNGKMYILGGYNSGASAQSDVWCSSDGVNWNEVTASAPWGKRAGFGLVVYNNKMWLIGGASTLTPNNALNDVWDTTDGVNWCEATANAAFAARWNLGAVVLNNQMYVLGGGGAFNPGGTPSYNDVWSSTDGVNWGPVTSAAGFPAGAGWLSTTCGNAMWVLANNSTWVSIDGKNWSQTSSTNPFSGANSKPFSYNGEVWVNSPLSGSGWLWQSACCLVPTPTPGGPIMMPLKGNNAEAGPSVTPTNTPTNTPTETITPSPTPTPIPRDALSVTAAPNVSREGQPIQFEVTLGQASQMTLALYSLAGEVVYSAQAQGNPGVNDLVWNVENSSGVPAASGLYVYVLQVNTGGTVKTLKGKVVIIR